MMSVTENVISTFRCSAERARRTFFTEGSAPQACQIALSGPDVHFQILVQDIRLDPEKGYIQGQTGSGI